MACHTTLFSSRRLWGQSWNSRHKGWRSFYYLSQVGSLTGKDRDWWNSQVTNFIFLLHSNGMNQSALLLCKQPPRFLVKTTKAFSGICNEEDACISLVFVFSFQIQAERGVHFLAMPFLWQRKQLESWWKYTMNLCVSVKAAITKIP